MVESGMDDRRTALASLRSDRRWRVAVWTLRLAFLGLLIVIVGVIVHRSSSTTGFAVLIAGLLVYVVGSVATLIEVASALRALPQPRPSFMSIRLDLFRDVFRR